MPGKKGRTAPPDAWDDEDWETKADRAAKEPPKEEPVPALSKPERMTLHRESNRKLWESAYVPPPRPLPARPPPHRADILSLKRSHG